MHMIKKNLHALAFLVLLSSLSSAGSITYTQDGTPVITVGSEAAGTSINNINADDSLYYIVNAVPTSNTTAVNNPTMNGSVNSWTNGWEYNPPGSSNTWAYTTATYVSPPGSGRKYILPSATQDYLWVAGTAYQAPTTTVDSTTVNYLNWSMRYGSLTNPGNVRTAAICAEIYGTINGVAGRQLYYCYFIVGSAPADTADRKFITLGSGSSTAWQSFSRNINADIESKWGSGATYTISQVRVVNFMITGNIPNNAGRSAFTAYYDDIYLLKGDNNQVDVRHKSQAGVSPPPGHALMRMMVSDKFYSTSSTATYQLQWWNANTSSWENCGAAAPQSSEGTRTCNTSTNPSYYINAADSSKVMMRLYSSATSTRHSLYENYLYYKIWFPNLTSTTISPTTDPAPTTGTSFQVNCTSSVDADYGINDANYYLMLSTDNGATWNPITTTSSGLKLNSSTPTNPFTSQSIPAGGSTTKSWYVDAVTAGTYQLKCVTNSTSAGEQNSSALQVTVTGPPGNATVWTGKQNYAACVPVYYKVRLFDSNNFLIDAPFNLWIKDSANATRYSASNIYPNNGTGTYTNLLYVNSTDPAGSWAIIATSGDAAGTKLFTVNP